MDNSGLTIGPLKKNRVEGYGGGSSTINSVGNSRTVTANIICDICSLILYMVIQQNSPTEFSVTYCQVQIHMLRFSSLEEITLNILR